MEILVHNFIKFYFKYKETYNGIDAETFRLGLIDKFASSHVSFTNTMFNTEALDKMKLHSYFNIIKAVKSKQLSDRLALFFRVSLSKKYYSFLAYGY